MAPGRTRDTMPLLKLLLLGSSGLLGLGLLAGVGLYTADYAVEADVVERRCVSPSALPLSTQASEIDVRTRLFGIEKTIPVRPDECLLIPDRAFVVYHLRSKHTLVYKSEGGVCLYDSEAPRGCG